MRGSVAKLAPRLSAKACYPSNIERQNVKLVLKIIHESTIAALTIQNDSRHPELKIHTSHFVEIILNLWKIFNVNTPYKGIGLNESLCRPLTQNDERFSFLSRIVKWLEVWESLLYLIKMAN